MYVTVLGAGKMGHGIAQVSAMAGHEVILRDVEDELVENGLEHIEANLDGGVDRDKLTPGERDETLARIEGTTELDTAVTGADLVVDAVPEDLDLEREGFAEMESHAPATGRRSGPARWARRPARSSTSGRRARWSV